MKVYLRSTTFQMSRTLTGSTRYTALHTPRPRIHLAGVPLHIVQHDHNREACFFGEDDSLAYSHWLGEAPKGSGCALHAYVLMSTLCIGC
jgi:hypothetical protein